ncbi:SDR family NAD(P)-dependent oxidoreductase [Cesiribacter sp. SM1]|uniref:SDR family NAD(P)-dependent oxidoreductase n=1 Tax=Cesiribacter sp. SM1 TaxID=2861196 RepID=UPI001CD7DE47|nr:SDR family NAD(P)-dependent oxidoreductase [Cesiribacter sp. SM1]
MNKDLKDKVIVITGGSSGIGAAAARVLTGMGAQLVISGRSGETKRLAAELNCDYYLVDYTSFTAVRQFAQSLLDKYPRIDVLVNNVGGIISNRRMTEDGHEMTLQVNHLSGFLLTRLLRERLEASEGIVINTSSAANTMGQLNFDDPESEQRYSAMRAYGTAKLMNILHAMEISRRFKGVRAASFHPGVVTTGFAREGSSIVKWFYESPLKNLFMISPEKGADTLVWLITSEAGKDWKEGEYYYKRKPGKKNKQVNTGNAQKLWEASEQLIEQSKRKTW